MSLTTLY